MSVQEIICDDRLKEVFTGTNFGSQTPRQVLASSLLKCACGYHTGHTANQICRYLGLTTEKWKLTQLGKDYLFCVFDETLKDGRRQAIEEAIIEVEHVAMDVVDSLHDYSIIKAIKQKLEKLKL